MTYDAIYLREACKVAAAESQDPRTQNGALLRAATGAVVTAANRFPSLVTSDRLESPRKYQFIEHAERGVIYAAAKVGMCTRGSTLYCPWFACADCARAIILSGVERVVGHVKTRYFSPERWAASIEAADQMLAESGVVRVFLDEELDVSFLFDDELLKL